MADNDKKLIAPYVEWAVATNFAYLPGKWFRVLLELNEPAADFVDRIENFLPEGFHQGAFDLQIDLARVRA